MRKWHLILLLLLVSLLAETGMSRELLNKRPIDLYSRPSKKSDLLYSIPPGSAISLGKKARKGWRQLKVSDGDQMIDGYAQDRQLRKNLYRETYDVKPRKVELRFREQIESELKSHISSGVLLSLIGRFSFAFQASQVIRSDFGQIQVDPFIGSELSFGINIDIPIEDYAQMRLSVRRDATDMSSKSETAIVGSSSSNIERKQSFLTLGLNYKGYAGDERKFYVLVGLEYSKGLNVELATDGGSAVNVSEGDIPNQFVLVGGFGREWTIKDGRVFIVTEALTSLVFSDPVGVNVTGSTGFVFRF